MNVGLTALLQAHVGDGICFYAISTRLIFNTAYYNLSWQSQKLVSKRNAKICNMDLAFWRKVGNKLSGDAELQQCCEVPRYLGNIIVGKDVATR